MKIQRIPGFDLARAYAIFGMYIVNFNIVFGNYLDASMMGKFLSLFSGNSSSMFVMLAGMGTSLLTFRPEAGAEERRALRRLILRRSWFLFFLGLALFLWWPADILHFYGAYMHMAAFLLFVPGRWLLLAAAMTVVVFHGLLLLVPYETGWNFDTLSYSGFWTAAGFLRNTFYNGWNPVFPWAAFFFLGMWLGRLDWKDVRLQQKALFWGAGLFLLTEGLIGAAAQNRLGEGLKYYLTADYLPPFLPFMMATGSFSLCAIVLCLWLGERLAQTPLGQCLSATGRMTLTHYLLHLTLGMLALSAITGRSYLSGTSANSMPAPALFAFSLFWFGLSMAFSHLWSKRFKNGPFEWLMRRIAG
jgi:uncharacterized membrane protein YeiB